MTPVLPEELRPGVMISGSSPAGWEAARAIGAVLVKYPKPPEEEEVTEDGPDYGIRVGIIAREPRARRGASLVSAFRRTARGRSRTTSR
jgi:alkanesulfonate monooxygenase